MAEKSYTAKDITVLGGVEAISTNPILPRMVKLNRLGRKKGSGFYSYDWDASNLASGLYLYRLQAGNDVETRKMVLMR